MNQLKSECIETVVEDSFGLWITALWSSIEARYQCTEYSEVKAMFLEILKFLLEEEIVKFCPPNELWKEGYDIWDAEPSEIVDYIRVRWPEDVSSVEDIRLVDFFYDDVPAILWVEEDGSIIGS